MNQVEHNDYTSLLGPLLKSINQIARFYETLPNTEDATKKMLAHLVSSWEPSMFLPLIEYCKNIAEEPKQEGDISPLAFHVLKIYRLSYLNH